MVRCTPSTAVRAAPGPADPALPPRSAPCAIAASEGNGCITADPRLAVAQQIHHPGPAGSNDTALPGRR